MDDVSARLGALCEALFLKHQLAVDRFVDELINIVQECKCLWGELHTESDFIFTMYDGRRVVFAHEPRRAKGRFRMVCAQMAAWAIRNGNHAVNPYGGHSETVVVGSRGEEFRMQIDHMNTTRSQWFRIEAIKMPVA